MSCTRRQFSGIAATAAVGSSLVRAETVKVDEPRSVIYIFLSGGLAQQDSFDPKPNAPLDIRGEFDSIATQTPGVRICEHLPLLAARSNHWSLVRSLSHPYNEHSQGHMVMLSGRSKLPLGFDPSLPKSTDHPSIAALLGAILPSRGGLPSSIVLPEKLIHRTGRILPGQFSGVMGKKADPWFLQSSRFNAKTYGAWPEYEFHHQRGKEVSLNREFRTPGLELADGMSSARSANRLDLLRALNSRGYDFSAIDEIRSFSRYQGKAISMLGNGRLSRMFDIESEDSDSLDRYGRNSFGRSLILARRLVEEGVGFVQVNLGNNETWDTHGNAFPHLKNYLLPPMDRSVSSLLDDLSSRGLLDSTLVVMAGEFGRTPKVFRLEKNYAKPGRDHWGAVQTVLLAGCGFGDGMVIGSSDRVGGQPHDDRQTPESLAATMFKALKIPRSTQWFDLKNRPLALYNADPISV